MPMLMCGGNADPEVWFQNTVLTHACFRNHGLAAALVGRVTVAICFASLQIARWVGWMRLSFGRAPTAPGAIRHSSRRVSVPLV